jgi:hypothetical protein
MSDVGIPTSYSINAGASTGVDIGLDEVALALQALNATVGATVGATLGGTVGLNLGRTEIDAGLDNIRLTELAPVRLEAAIKEIAPVRLEASIKEIAPIRTDSKVDLGLDDIRLTELPPIQLELGMRPFRLHLPLNYSFCLELFGVRLFKFSICGEGMAISEDYHPHATERCE